MKRMIVSLLLIAFAVSGCVAYPGGGYDWHGHDDGGHHDDNGQDHNQGR